MKEEKRLLRKGDVLYSHALCSNILHRSTVERVTKTQAIDSLGGKFKNKEVSMLRNLVRIGDTGFVPTVYDIETPELKEMYKRQVLIGILNRFDPKKYSTDALLEICDTINRAELK